MSGSLLEIKKKTQGVQNTRKITKAMQLVAASKMRQFQKRAIHARGYVWDLLEILVNNLNASTETMYTKERDRGKTLFVLYTSDKGLCGPLNTKLINCLFRSEKWKQTPHDERLLITIGRKGNNTAKSNKIPVHTHFTGVPEKLGYLDALDIVEEILKLWRNEEVKEVLFIAPHYKNSFTSYPLIKTFLPFTKKAVRTHIEVDTDTERNTYMIFSPGEEEVQRILYEQIIHAIFIQAFLELKASEYSSRMIAMQNATDSANRMITDLQRIYNKARQQAITQEIAELIGASMALAES